MSDTQRSVRHRPALLPRLHAPVRRHLAGQTAAIAAASVAVAIVITRSLSGAPAEKMANRADRNIAPIVRRHQRCAEGPSH